MNADYEAGEPYEPDPYEAGPGRLERIRSAARRAGQSVAGWFNKAEWSYLALLRQTSLFIATLLMFGAVLMFVVGLWWRTGNPDAIQAEQVAVAAQDVVTPAEPPKPKAESKPADDTPRWARVLPAAFREQYYRTFRASFAPYYRQADKRPDRKAFFDTMFPDPTLDYIQSFDDARLVQTPEREESNLRPLLASLQTVMSSAAANEATKRELQGYRAAKKVQVCETVRRTRTRFESFWNDYATNCPYWYEPPYGCRDTRAVTEPYTDRVCRMEFPDQIANPQNLMLRLQGRYFSALDRKLQTADAAADERRQQMMARKANGSSAIETAGKAFAAFLALMFLYILVAVERHHRLISGALASRR